MLSETVLPTISPARLRPGVPVRITARPRERLRRRAGGVPPVLRPASGEEAGARQRPQRRFPGVRAHGRREHQRRRGLAGAARARRGGPRARAAGAPAVPPPRRPEPVALRFRRPGLPPGHGAGDARLRGSHRRAPRRAGRRARAGAWDSPRGVPGGGRGRGGVGIGVLHEGLLVPARAAGERCRGW